MGVTVHGGERLSRQVRQVREALRSEYEGLIDLSDFTGNQQHAIESAWFSRALAAKAAQILTRCSSADAAAAVVDGRDDYGIDAVAFSREAPILWLVQAKWSDKGTAGFNTEAANKLARGLKKLDNREYGAFNSRLQALETQIEDVLNDPRCQIRLVIAVMGDGRLSAETGEILQEAATEFGTFNRSVTHEVVNGARLYQAIRADIEPDPIAITATMTRGWHRVAAPYEAYYGLVSAGELASWHHEHGDGLYERNVCRSLGLTRVNEGLIQSMLTQPEQFWYLHNGITVLCESVETTFFSSRVEGKPVRLHLQGASVVNGAQTVTSARRAFERDPEATAQAYVSVRVISIGGEPAFGDRITEATNTQNHTERRDFIAIDETQRLIREDLKLSLGKEYVLKRGELEPLPEAGCSVVEAATALACAHPDPRLAIRVKGSTELLWEDGSKGTYTQLFGQRPGADQIWRSVLLLRGVHSTLHRLGQGLAGRAGAIADNGRLLITHMVFQLVGQDGIDDPASSWEDCLEEVGDWTEKVLTHLIHQINERYGATSYVASTFANDQRGRELVNGVIAALRAGVPESQVVLSQPARPIRARRPTTVQVLVDSVRLAEGTRLEFFVNHKAEQAAMGEWLAADPRRSLATWTNDRIRPLLWEADGQQYSPTSLTRHMWELAEWKEAWVSVQGPQQWRLPGGSTLVDLAEEIRQANEED